jgi:aryl-alcohol dehydrogenase-like predicted oxidoreductase
MNYRRFGSEETTVSEVGLGCWQIGGGAWGPIDGAQAAGILQGAYEEGVTFFDTADVYGGGRSEKRIGRFLRNHEGAFVATKLGRRGDPGGAENLRLDVMRRHTEDSLERLGVDRLDLTQLHCIPTAELERGEVFDHLRTLKEEGLIRRFGASVESMDEALLCLEQPDLASLQIIFNIFRQKPIDALFGRAREAGVAIIVRLPLASGLLAGKFTSETTFSERDHRNFNRDGEAFNVGETFAGLEFEKGVALVEELKRFVPEGLTMPQMAIRWILDHEAVTTVIPGASRVQQARSNAEVSELEPLNEDLHARLRAFYEEKAKRHIRGPY